MTDMTTPTAMEQALDALEMAESQLTYLDELFPAGTTANTLTKIDAAIPTLRAAIEREGWQQRLIEWLLGNDTGSSSKAVAAWLGAGIKRRDTPSDGGDFGRCYRLIELMGWKDRVPELASLSGRWAVIVEHWAELDAAYQDDKATYDPSARRNSSKVYEILKRIKCEGYERDGYEVTRNASGGLSSARKKSGETTIDLGGMSISFGG